MEKRKFIRFPVDLKVKAGKEITGTTKDFSRDGLRVIFDDFSFGLDSLVDMEIQSPTSDASIPLVAKPLWKRLLDGKWNVGFMFAELAPTQKQEVLEYGYKKWVREKTLASV